MASSGRGSSSMASMRKKRRTIGGFRAHAMGDSFDHNNTTADASSNFSLSMVPENQLSCLGDSGSEHIVVAVRVRPLSATEIAEGKRSCCDVLTRNTLVIRKGADPGAYLRSQKGSANEYSFDAVFPPEAGQAEVYEGTAKPHIAELLEGINVTVFAYGATGAGKTHTMMGSERVVGTRAGDAEEVSGIVPQSLVELFRLIDERAEAGSGDEDETETWKVRVGYLQVYNEQIMDLLSNSSKPLKINEDPAKGVVVVAGLAEMEVSSSEEVLELLRQGNANRRTEATGANQVSSRSHAVLQVVVTRTLGGGLSGAKSVRESKLSLIDLAGSERASATNNRGEQLRQGANINKSLLSLANCINALAGNRRRRGGKQGPGNVKYRDSKLTHLLKASLEGRCRLVMIANVNPSHVFFDDSHNTLKYANRAKNIKVDPRTAELVRGASRLMTENEAKMAKEYQALKERNQLVEAQLESMKSSRGYIAPEPAGFTDLFAPNTSSIMSVASSTPGYAERYGGNAAPPHQQQLAGAPAPGAATAAGVSSKSGGGGAEVGGHGRARRSGGGGLDAMLPPPIPRCGGGGGGGSGGFRGGNRRMSEEGFVDSGEDCGMMASPAAAGGEVCLESGGGGSSSSLSSSSPGSKRKRTMAMRDSEEEEDAEVVKAAAAAAAAVADEEIKKLKGELSAERTRVCELEGKVRELESSMARMGAQHDVNMELIDTFRHQKETAEEAAECERATADELLGLLKEKESEISQLRSELDEVSRSAMSASASTTGGAVGNTGGNAVRSIMEEQKAGGQGAGSSGFRSGLMMEGDSSAFGPLGQIEENEGGGVEDMELEHDGGAASRQQQTTAGMPDRGSRDSMSSSTNTGGAGRRSETASASPSFPVASAEVASAIKANRRKSSMIPRSRKSMIPAPRSSGRSAGSRKLGDVTNSSTTRLNDHLGASGGNTPCGVIKKEGRARATGGGGGCDRGDGYGGGSGLQDMTIDVSGKGRASSRRVSSRTGQTPQRQTIAARTRSRVSLAPATSLRGVR